MRYIYSLRIEVDAEYRQNVNSILNIECNYPYMGWGLEIIQEEEQPYFDYINYFLDLLENKYFYLEELGVSKEDISIWMIYEYNEQCNIEFGPKDLKRIGDNGISLCISCYEI